MPTKTTYKRIKVGKTFAIVDGEDFERLSEHTWYYQHGYGRADIAESGKRKRVYLHHMVVGKHPSKFVDHINRNGLDNRRSNLRFASPGESVNNRRPFNKSGYKGVYTDDGKRWYVKVCRDYKSKTWGGFKTPEEAALFYNDRASELFGEFAYQNELRSA